MTLLRTRASIVSLLALAVAAGGCGGSGSSTTNATTTPIASTTTSSSATSPSTAPTSSSSSSTTVPVSATANAVWPTTASATRFNDPAAATRSFAVDYLHMVNPLVGTFAQGDARSGEIAIRATARGPRTTVLLRQLDTDGTWWITGCATPNIRATAPAPLARISSPVSLRGRSTAFEATVNVAIREDNRSTPLAETFVMGGANGELGPFDAAISFTRPAAARGAIVLYTISPESGHVAEATVLRVAF